MVLDPFLGSGTTAYVAEYLQRDCIGIELNQEYVAMAVARLNKMAGIIFQPAISEVLPP
jgi:DNA modification methylase